MEFLGILLKINVSLIVFYLVYRVALRKLTFYNFNRIYLLSAITVSAAIPAVHYNSKASDKISDWQRTVGFNPRVLSRHFEPDRRIDLVNIAEDLYWTGVIIMAAIFLVQLASLAALYTRCHKADHSGYSIRTGPDDMQPFSFFRSIFVDPRKHTGPELDSILKHETVHVKQWHSFDIILGEIKRIFCWFNPAAWLMLGAIRENLEFIADREVLQNGLDRKDYQYALLTIRHTGTNDPLTNNFNFSHLKLRITMMNKTRSSDMHLLKYLLAVPVVAGALLLTNFAQAQEQADRFLKTAALSNGAYPARTGEANYSNINVVPEAMRSANVPGPADISTSTITYTTGEPTKYEYTNLRSFKITASDNDGSDLKFTDDHSSFIFESDQNNAIAAASAGLSKKDVIVYLNGALYTKPMNTIDPKSIVAMEILSGHAKSDLQRSKHPHKTIIDLKTEERRTAQVPENNNGVVKGLRSGIDVVTLGLENINEISAKNETKKNIAVNDEPYIFVNGAPYHNGLAYLEPKNIKEIIVLKDMTVRNKYPQLPEGASVIEIKMGNGTSPTSPHHINIYPNPTSNKWKMDFPDAGANDSYELFDQQGRRRDHGKLNKTNEIDASRLETGVYFLKVKLATGNTEVRLEVIK